VTDLARRKSDDAKEVSSASQVRSEGLSLLAKRCVPASSNREAATWRAG
jgi:hypothetical protein